MDTFIVHTKIIGLGEFSRTNLTRPHTTVVNRQMIHINCKAAALSCKAAALLCKAAALLRKAELSRSLGPRSAIELNKAA